MPNTLEFEVGWLKGNSKKWLVVQEDLGTMYSKCTGNEISLWCDVSRDEGRILNQVAQRRKEKDAVESITDRAYGQLQ